jgi:hypothetical protein
VEVEDPIGVGDIVLGYHKGYWKVLKAGRILEYQRIDVKPGSKPVIKSCDRGWCTKIDPEAQYYKQIKEAFDLMDLLMKAKGTN